MQGKAVRTAQLEVSGGSDRSSATQARGLGSEASSPACGPDVTYREPRDQGVGGDTNNNAAGGCLAACLLCVETDLFAAGHPQPPSSSARPIQGLDLNSMIRSQRSREAELLPDPHYLEAHAAAAEAPTEVLTPQMRMIVVSWMVEVCDEFALQPETLHLAVVLLDRFLSATVPHGVPRDVLQMVAVACIMVAAKDLEVNHPDVGQLTAIAANCFTAQDLLRMERVLLESIDFKITNQTGYSFLHLYAQGLSGIEPLIAASAVYLLELALLDYSLLKFAPSHIAAAALILAMQTHGRAGQAPHVLQLSGYSLPEMAQPVSSLLQTHQSAAWPEHQGMRDLLAPIAAKYSQQSWCCVALCQPLPALDLDWFSG